MKIGIAQIRPVKGDLAENIILHKKWIDVAIGSKADLIYFSELSLTGYEPELAEGLAIDEADAILDEFQTISDANKISIGVGIPTKTKSGTRISMVIFQPSQPRQIYSKQQLHSDEFPFFVQGDHQLVINVCGEKIAPAICYETLQESHAGHAKKLGAEIYLASVAKTQKGIEKVMTHYPHIAKKYSMPVVMSNCIGYFDNSEMVGGSAVWNQHGTLLAQLDGTSEGMLVFDTESEEVIYV